MKQTMIILQTGTGLEQYFNHASNLLYQDYENSPSSLIDIPISPEERGDIAYYNTLSSQLIPAMHEFPHTPLGKLVI